jgi:hypothetical protein
MFEGLSPEVEALLDAAAADLPAAQADAGLLAAMAEGVSIGTSPTPIPTPRRKSVLGKVITAKVAAIAGVLVLTGGVASAAASGTLPDSAQDAASDAAEHVGLHIPKGEHGAAVSGVARDKSNDGDDNHGTAVCTVASEGKCKSGDDEGTDDESGDNRGPGGSSAEHRQDGEHRKGNSIDDDSTTTTTGNDDSGEDESDDDQPKSEHGKNKGNSGDHVPDDHSGPGSSDDD